MLKLKHISIREDYAEGQVPRSQDLKWWSYHVDHELPYLKNWINDYPFWNSPDVNLICNIMTGAPVKPETMCTMNQLKI